MDEERSRRRAVRPRVCDAYWLAPCNVLNVSVQTIFHRPLIDGDVKSGTGGPVISIEAEGIYSDDSKYRYLIEFTLGELEAVIGSSGPALGAGRPVSTGPNRRGHQDGGETSASILHLNRRSE